MLHKNKLEIQNQIFPTSNWVNKGKTPVENMARHWVWNLLGDKKIKVLL